MPTMEPGYYWGRTKPDEIYGNGTWQIFCVGENSQQSEWATSCDWEVPYKITSIEWGPKIPQPPELKD